MMRSPLTRAMLVLALCCSIPLRAQSAAAGPASSLRFSNARLEDVIVAIGQMLGLTIVTTDTPDKRVTLTTATPVRSAELGAFSNRCSSHMGW